MQFLSYEILIIIYNIIHGGHILLNMWKHLFISVNDNFYNSSRIACSHIVLYNPDSSSLFKLLSSSKRLR